MAEEGERDFFDRWWEDSKTPRSYAQQPTDSFLDISMVMPLFNHSNTEEIFVRYQLPSSSTLDHPDELENFLADLYFEDFPQLPDDELENMVRIRISKLHHGEKPTEEELAYQEDQGWDYPARSLYRLCFEGRTLWWADERIENGPNISYKHFFGPFQSMEAAESVLYETEWENSDTCWVGEYEAEFVTQS